MRVKLNYALIIAETEMSPEEYEELTRTLMENLASRFGLLTTRLQRDVTLQGRSTSNQIDVIWEVRIGDELHRFLFECRRYKSKIVQGQLHAFRSVVDDIGGDIPTTGVMVTTTGYQKGAKRVAETYGLLVAELRTPTEADLAGKILRVQLDVNVRQPVVRDISFEFSELLRDGEFSASADLITIVVKGEESSLLDVLLEGECSQLGDPPTPPHAVTRTFEPPATLMIGGEPIVAISAAHALVGDLDAAFSISVGPGEENLAWILKNAIGDTEVWFAKDGSIYAIGGQTAAD